ncbi:YciI family protein [Mucilaginibacter sp. HD30]
MKAKAYVFLLAVLCCSALTQAQTKPAFDAALAKKLGADDYGMRQYVMAFLKSGPTKITDKAEMTKLQMAHLQNIERLAKEGKLALAGPFTDDKEIEGIFIFNVKTVEEAKALTETDPGIKAGAFVMELHPFYCSAALLQVTTIHNKIQKKDITDR